MTIVPEIIFMGMEASPDIERRIRDKVNWLIRLSQNIVSCRVVVEAPHHRYRVDDLYGLKLRVTLPGGGDVVVSRSPEFRHAHEDFTVTLRDAFEAARRQLEIWERKHSRRDEEIRFSGRMGCTGPQVLAVHTIGPGRTE